MPPNTNPYHPFGKSLAFALKLVIKYSDGTTEEITVDETFKTKPHINTITFSDDDWPYASIIPKEDEPKGRLVNQSQSPIRVIRTYEGKHIGTIKSRQILDFSQNMSAILELEVKGRAGDRVLIYPAEKLDEKGGVDQMVKNWMLIGNVITYVIGKSDQWETVNQFFTYFAGRFLGIDGSAAVR